MTTAEIEDMFDEPQTCHPAASCGECWRTFGTKKRCQTPGSDLWTARTLVVEVAASEMAAVKYDRSRALGKRTEEQVFA